MDNNIKSERLKEEVYWNLFAFDHLYSLTSLVEHYRQPSSYTQRDYDWRDFFFTTQLHQNGKAFPQTFIQRSKYYFSDIKTFDRVSLYESQAYDLKIIKHEFWNRVLSLKSSNKQNYESKNIVRQIIWKKRPTFFLAAFLSAAFLNKVTGINKLKFSKRMFPYIVFGIGSQILLRYKNSSQIFYKIPELPAEDLEKERKEIINECIIFDGTINDYDQLDSIDKAIEKGLQKTKDSEKRKEIIEAMGYKIINSTDL